jgi:transitional endoplasmic reticulum ATPase
VGQRIGAGAARLAGEADYLFERTRSSSSPERFAWLQRCLIALIIVGGEYLLLRPFSSRLDDLLSLTVSWLVMFLLPKPTPRLLLLAARFAAVGATLMNMRAGMHMLEAAIPSLAGWAVALAVVWVGLMAVGIVWTLRALRPPRRPAHAAISAAEPVVGATDMETAIPELNFSAVGGFDRVKEEIRLIAENRLRRNTNGIVRNGILLYGPQGTGKNLIAEATAGECRVNFHHVRCPELVGVHIGSTSAEIRRLFEWAFQHRPIVLFLDELDSIGSRKQAQGVGTDAGGAGREYNTVTTQLMQSIDRSRRWEGFLLIAASNFLDGLEPTMIREGRFDAKLRLDLPDESGRGEILKALLGQARWQAFDVAEVARSTPGWSPARLKSLVDRAVLRAGNGLVEQWHLIEALEASGGWDRPLLERVEWNDVVLPQAVVDDLKTLLRLLEPGEAERLSLPAPTGLILVGAPGTGKTLTARLIASQSGRSFYPVTPAEILHGAVGGSVKRLAEVFARAKEHAPSILFFDEMDALLPNVQGPVGHHDLQLVEQALIEISALRVEHNVFLVGTTNYAERIDPRILRGGRFSEKIEIGLPDDAAYRALLMRCLGATRLADGLILDGVIERFRGLSPADLQAGVTAAKRAAMRRMREGASELPPMTLADLDEGLRRIR